MRQITKQAANALHRRQTFAQSNTCVDGTAMYVHGSCVAAVMPQGIQFSMSGWPTKLTRERLNGVFDKFGLAAVLFQRKGEQLLSLPHGVQRLDPDATYLLHYTENGILELCDYYSFIPI
jgi:hypothetical protein